MNFTARPERPVRTVKSDRLLKATPAPVRTSVDARLIRPEAAAPADALASGSPYCGQTGNPGTTHAIQASAHRVRFWPVWTLRRFQLRCCRHARWHAPATISAGN